MVRTALLVGVSEGIDPLSEPINDIKGIQQILEEPSIGEFNPVTVLPNPTDSDLRVEIYNFFRNREPDDTLLFYFSGHGLRDRLFKFYLATSNTQKDDHGALIPPTAVPATYLQEQMTNSRSEKQVIILDCCFSEAFVQGLKVKGELEIETELGGNGRAILLSSSDKQFSFESEDAELSIYTRYLIEGLKTGAAALPGKEWITPKGLHEYVSSKIAEAAPAMTPKFYSIDEGLNIYLAHSPATEPKLKYRQEAQKGVRKGKFSIVNRRILNRLAQDLKLTEEEAKAIEAEILRPYQEYQQKLREYEEALSDVIEIESTLTDSTLSDLKDFQNLLKLRDEDIAPIHQKLISSTSQSTQPIPPVQQPPPSTAKPPPEIELKSEKGVDYTKLRDLLAAGKWKEADQETDLVMCEAANRVYEGDLRVEDLDNFPCEDLRTIDQLWVKYSNGKFGFSVQKKIYMDELGGTVDNQNIWEEFCNRVGWMKGGDYVNNLQDITFELLDTTPRGHLPLTMVRFPKSKIGIYHLFSSLVQRLVTCRVTLSE